MNSNQVQNLTAGSIPATPQQAFAAIAEWLRAAAAEIRAKRQRDTLHRIYSGLDDARLRDIGMHDPQKQLQVLGRYL